MRSSGELMGLWIVPVAYCAICIVVIVVMEIIIAKRDKLD